MTKYGYSSPELPDMGTNGTTKLNTNGDTPTEAVQRVVDYATGERQPGALPESAPSDATLQAVADGVRRTLEQFHAGEIPTERP